MSPLRRVLVLQQYWFDGYRAIQSVQDKAQVSLPWQDLQRSIERFGLPLRANQKAVIHVVAFLVKGVTLPFKTRLVDNCFLTRCTYQTNIVGVIEK